MKNETGKKRKQYQKALKKLPRLYEISEQIYADYMQSKKDISSGEEAWAGAFCYVLAPTLLLYVLWVLTDALKNGKRRLYFLARDGYMMYHAAQCICTQWQIPIECRYLYCSRYSLRSGEYRLLKEKSLDYICLGGLNVTFEKMMQRGGLSAEEAAEIGSSMGMKDAMNEQLTFERIQALYPELKSSSLFMEKVLTHSAEKYPNVIGYFRQEGLMDGIPYAIVDSGWTGSIQKSINHLLQSTGYNRKAEGYYFGLYECVKGAERELYHTYFFAPENGNGRKAFFCNNLFECVFSSPEGMTVGYRKIYGRYEPVLKQENNPNRRYIEAGTQLILYYAQAYAGGKKTGKRIRTAMSEQRLERQTLSRLIALFMGQPTMEEARVFGEYVFNDDVTGEEEAPLVSVLNRQQLKERKLLQRLLRYIRGLEHPAVISAWPEGSTVLAQGTDADRILNDTLYKFLLYSRKSLAQKRKSDRRHQKCRERIG